MRLCDICNEAGDCTIDKYGYGRCISVSARQDIWHPMSEAVPKGRPILTAQVLRDGTGWPMTSVVTIFDGDVMVSWPNMSAFSYEEKEHVAWCDFTTLKLRFEEE